MANQRKARPGQRPAGTRTTIQDVATEAGVSLTTVSHVLNGKGRVDARTRDHVRAVADRLGYVPSRTARGLASGRSYTIGLSLPQLAALPPGELLDSQWYAQVVVASSQRALDRQYAVAVLPGFTTTEELGRHAVDGVVVLDPVHDDPRFALLERARIPHVSVGRDPLHLDVPAVHPDALGGAAALLTHLAQRGSRRILLLSAPVEWQHVHDTVAHARQWSAGRDVTVRHIIAGEKLFSRESLYEDVRRATATALTAAEPPDAIVGMFEGFGATIAAGAAAEGCAVPTAVRVAQDTDDRSTLTASPAITALDQHPDQQARAAVDLLLDLIAHRVPADDVVTPVTLRVRAST
ncbi:LacI family DNA-binding transcriptional regulator [Streptomyces sp. NRRL S-1813]|uniref:LacI family DNA-binding transcriptional regulator n=1 Tax=Streptomyces sp. NRRL S-1813 TaxID=1463888 RepID=UPI00131BE704|nr:LacI family DNA-binding transcriptional regulator [Streptomyces sp. NRRL S-1813]